MSKILQLRGGTTAEHATFTGAVREVTVDTDKNTLVVHDGSTAGGFVVSPDDATVRASVEAATDSNVFTDADHSKLDGIEANATADQTAGEIKTSYESNANTNAFTDADQTKLSGIETGAEVNTVDSVNTQTGAVVLDADDISDASTTNKFTTSGDISKLAGIEAGATADQTAAEIRVLVESATDSNVFTDADHSKLDGIEAGATADQTAAEIKTAYESNANTNEFSDAEQSKLAGIETGATADQTKADIDALNVDADTLDGQHGSYYTGYTDTVVANLVDSAPGTLDTLNELAAALGDDPNFATTTATNIGTKANKTITVSAGSGLTGGGDLTANRTISHADTSTVSDVNGSGNTFIQDIGFDTYGHVTSVGTGTVTVGDGAMTVTAGSGLSGGGQLGTANQSGASSVTVSHADTSTQASLTALTGAAVVSDIDVDTYGHVTGLATRNLTLANLGYTGETNATADQTITAGSGLSGGGTGNVTLSHSDTSSQASVNNSGATVIQDVTLDTYGHVTGLASKAMTLADLGYTGATNANYITNNNQLTNGAGYTTNVGDITGVTAGSGITGGGTSGTVTINHADTSSQASVNNSGRTYIQDITLDTYGHITGITSATETVVNTDTNTNQLTTFQVEDGDGNEVTISHGKEWKFTEAGGININWTDTSNGSDADPYDLSFNISTSITAGGGLTGGGALSSSRTISHADTSSQASVNGSGRTYIQDITLDTYGHVTGIATATETVVNTDTNTTYSAGTNLSLSGTTFNVSSNPSFTDVYVADQILHTGDTNTYMQFHAADQWRVVVGGSERLEVKNSSPHVLVSGDLNSTSDIRLKDDIKPIENALSDVCKLEGVSFNWKDTGTKATGFIAQQVEPILPDLVSTSEDDGIKSVNYIGLIGHLVEAIKEQQAQINELKQKLNS